MKLTWIGTISFVSAFVCSLLCSAVALAQPIVVPNVDGIATDGDLSDWPQEFAKEPLSYGRDRAVESDDFFAHVLFGFDQERLLLHVAVVVKDDSHCLEATAAAYVDGAVVRLQVPGNDNEVFDDHVELAANHENGMHSYEWQFDLMPWMRNHDIDETGPIALRVCAEAMDVDADGSRSIRVLAPQARSKRRPGRQVLLNINSRQLGTVRARLLSSRTVGLEPSPIWVRYASRDHEHFMVDLPIDASSPGEVRLPAGDYRRSLLDHQNTEANLRVRAGRVRADTIQALHVHEARFLKESARVPFGKSSPKVISSLSGTTRFSLQDYELDTVPRDVVVDGQARVWLATAKGLVKLDGGEAIVYSLLNESLDAAVTTLYLENDQLWVGTDHGLCLVSTSTLRTTPILLGESINDIGRLHDGRLAVATETGVLVPAAEESHRYVAGSDVRQCLSLQADPSGDFTWIGTEHGVVRFDGIQAVDVRLPTTQRPRTTIREILIDQSGCIWFEAKEEVFRWFDGDFHTVPGTEMTVNSQIRLLQGSDRKVWAKSSTKGDSSVSNQLVSLDSSQEVSAHLELDFHEGRVGPWGSLWLCTATGVTRVDAGQRRIARDCFALTPSHDGWGLWMAATVQGQTELRYLDTRTNVMSRFSCPYEVTCLAVDRVNGVCLGTRGNGVVQFDRSNRFKKIAGVEWTDSPIQDVLVARSGVIWVATLDGVLALDECEIVASFGAEDGLASGHACALEELQDGVIACASSRELWLLDPQGGKIHRPGNDFGVDDVATIRRLPELMTSESGVLWIGTQSGLQSYQDGILRTFENPFGPLIRDVRWISQDASGRIWVATPSRVFKLKENVDRAQLVMGADEFGGLRRLTGLAVTNRHYWLNGEPDLIQVPLHDSRPSLRLSHVNGVPVRGDAIRVNQGRVAFEFTPNSFGTSEDGYIFCYRFPSQSSEWKYSRNPSVEFFADRLGEAHLEIAVYDRHFNSSPLVDVDFVVVPPVAAWTRSSMLYGSPLACLVFVLFYAARTKRKNSEIERRMECSRVRFREVEAEKRRLTNELFQAQKMESLGTMASGLAHDFNNTLCAVVGNAELGLMSIEDKRRVQNSLRQVIDAAQQAACLTKNLLTFAGKSSSPRNSQRLDRIVEEAVLILRRTLPAAVQTKVDIPERPVWCAVDESQIKQVVINLVMNAADAMEQRGVIGIEISSSDACGRSVAILRVKDQGSGIEPDRLSQIFEPFYTTKSRGRGTGLGLSIVNSIVGSHDGQILVDSRLGKGTCFEIMIPLAEPVQEAVENQQRRESLDLPRDTGIIVVADDEARVRNTLVQAIESLQVRVIGVSDGEELVRTAIDEIDSLALILADVDMPHKSGVDAVLELRDIDPDLPVLFITGTPGPLPTTIYSGPTAVLRKPFSLKDLLHEAKKLTRPVPERPADAAL